MINKINFNITKTRKIHLSKTTYHYQYLESFNIFLINEINMWFL